MDKSITLLEYIPDSNSEEKTLTKTDDDQQNSICYRIAHHLFPSNNNSVIFPNLYSNDTVIMFIAKLRKYFNYPNIIIKPVIIKTKCVIDIFVKRTIEKKVVKKFVVRFYESNNFCIINKLDDAEIPIFLRKLKRTNNNRKFIYIKTHQSFIRLLCSILYIIYIRINDLPSEQRILEFFDFSKNFLFETLTYISSRFHNELCHKGIVSTINVYSKEEKYCHTTNIHQFDLATTINKKLSKLPKVQIRIHPDYTIFLSRYNFFLCCNNLNFCGNIHALKKILGKKYDGILFNDPICDITTIMRINKLLVAKTFLIHKILKEFVPTELNFVIMMLYIKSSHFDWELTIV